MALKKAFDCTVLSGNTSDSATLLRAATVVWHRRHVGNRVDPNAERTQGAHRRLATRAGAFDFDVQILDALLDRSATSHLRSHLRSKRGRLARALEALATR